MDQTFGQRLALCRHHLALSQHQLAARTAIPQGTISRLEAGQRAPGATILIALAQTLHCSVDWLLGLPGTCEDHAG